MPNQWIEYVRHYQKTHNVSYKEALRLASDTYKMHTIISGNGGCSSRHARNRVVPIEEMLQNLPVREHIIHNSSSMQMSEPSSRGSVSSFSLPSDHTNSNGTQSSSSRSGKSGRGIRKC